MEVELGFPFFSLLLHQYLSLPQLENGAALREDGANPHLHIQFLKGKLTRHSVQSWTKTDPRSVSISTSSAFQLSRKICCLPIFSRLWLFSLISSYPRRNNQTKGPPTCVDCWKRGEGISLASKSFDSWHGNEPIPSEMTSLLLIFPGYQSIYEPLLTSREVLMNQVFKNNIHQEVVNYSPSILWMNSRPTFPGPSWYPSAATWVFIQGLNLLSANRCLGFHQVLTHQHPARLSVLTQRKKGERKKWSRGDVRRGSKWRTKASSGHPEGSDVKGVTHSDECWISAPHAFQALSWATNWIKYHLVWLAKALYHWQCVWYGLFAEAKICRVSS